MLNGGVSDIVICTVTAVIGVFFMGISIAGYLKKDMNMIIRLIITMGCRAGFC